MKPTSVTIKLSTLLKWLLGIFILSITVLYCLKAWLTTLGIAYVIMMIMVFYG